MRAVWPHAVLSAHTYNWSPPSPADGRRVLRGLRGPGSVAVAAGLALASAPAASSASAAPASTLVVWAWERPEDFVFLKPPVEAAVQTGFVELSGDTVVARGRRFPLRVAPERVTTALVHVQVDPTRPLDWTPAVRAKAAAAVLAYARVPPMARLQVDFEVRRSDRQVLLDLLHDVRTGLAPGVRLSMTALASWCAEGWLDRAAVDEVVPMLFRMGAAGAALKARFAAGGDFADPLCRRALAVSVDTPIPRAPAARRVYLFSPRSWTPADFDRARREVAAWDGQAGSAP